MSDGIDIFDPSPRQRIIWRIAQAGALYWCVKTTLRQTLRPGLGDEVEWRGQRWILMNGIYPDSWKAKPKGGEYGDGLVPRDEVVRVWSVDALRRSIRRSWRWCYGDHFYGETQRRALKISRRLAVKEGSS